MALVTDNSESSRQIELRHEICVCTVEEIGKRKRVQLPERDITLFNIKGGIHAIDSYCYHAGGPLYNADIEDFGGKTCLVCPWHKYKVCIASGEMVYQAIDPHNPKAVPKWKNTTPKQRLHEVIIRDGHVYVKLTDGGDNVLDSDQYNSKHYREKLGLS